LHQIARLLDAAEASDYIPGAGKPALALEHSTTTRAIATVSEARAAANAWLITHLPDRFAAGIPAYEPAQNRWRIPVWLSYPDMEPLGPVGELSVDAVRGDVHAHTPIADMKALALQLYEHARARIEAPLL